ncbi:trans-1,2-dihydrobenzene-1,2-diol dehydrogenase [Arthrobacter sp. Hiyo4]|nr:trans-1,2-dihydrobenzene-1,2-diol dehydrogenase [Arthrobacter sp. Hiyo4]
MALPSLPASRVPDSRDAPALRWGIMGPGWIAERFTESVQAHTTQVIAAVGSRSLARSEAFADTFGVPAAYGSYEELAAAPGIDIVYVCTPHNFHQSAAILAIDAGKHVLIEKPLGLNALQARDIAARAAAADVFAAEAMWSFFLPKFDVIRQVLDAGVLGTVSTVLAEYGEHFDRSHRIFDPALAGGRCWTWAPTRWHSSPKCWVRRSGCRPSGSRMNPVSTPSFPPSWNFPAEARP